MIKKPIVWIAAIVIVVVAGALVFANYGNLTPTNSTNSIQGNQQNISTDNTSVNESNLNNTINSNPKTTSDNTKIHVKITPAQAKKIAQENNEIPGDIAGTPRLHKDDGRYIYTVHFTRAKTRGIVGSMDIDAQTGEVLGGWNKGETPY